MGPKRCRMPASKPDPAAMSPSLATRLAALRRRATPARACLAAALVGALAFAGALALQHIWKMEPCPLCIFQRVALLASSAAFALAAAAFKPRPRAGRALAALAGLFAAAGFAIAAKHLHVTWFPQEISCGPDLEYLMDAFSPAQWIPKVFAGSAECAAAGKQLVLGLPIPAWTAALFAGQAASGAWAWARKAQKPTVGRPPGTS